MLKLAVLVVASLLAASSAYAEGYYAVCSPMRFGPPKKPHAEWRGPCRTKYADAKKDADEHNKQFPEHGARVVLEIDGAENCTGDIR